jgi:predicted MFS family arabinose efflux permease
MHSASNKPPSPYGISGLFPPEHRRSIILCCAALFFYWSALYIFVPTLPVYARSLGASLSLVGIVVAFYGVPQFLFRIPIGVWFDSISRHKMLVAGGIIMTSIGALGLGLAPTPWWLCAARAITGIGAATWVTFAVYFTAYYPQQNVARAIGIANFIQQITVMVASAAGGVTAEVWGFKVTCFIAAVLGCLAVGAILMTREPVIPRHEGPPWGELPKVAASPMLLIVSFMAILLHFTTFSSTFSFISVFGAEIGASRTDLGILTMLSVGGAGLTSLVAVYLAERRGYSFTLVLGALIGGLSLVVTPFIDRVFLLEIAQLGGGLGRGMVGTIAMTLAVESAASRQRATAMGFYQAVYALGMLSGPLLSGYLADSRGLAAVFYLSAALCLVIAVMALLPALRHHRASV